VLNSNRALITSLLSRKNFPIDAISLKERLGGRELVLYGAGEASHLFVEIIMFTLDIFPALVLDKSFSSPGLYHNIPAYSIENCTWPIERRSKALVVVSTGKQSIENEIISISLAHGFCDVIPMMSIYEIHNPFSQPSRLYSDGYQYFHQCSESIISAFDLLEDDISEAVFCGVFHNHCTRIPAPVPMRHKFEHNFPKDLPFSINYESYLCCGADSHQLSFALNMLHDKIRHLFVIDPMIEGPMVNDFNFKVNANITMIPCALGNSEGIVRFTRKSSSRSTTFGCRISSSGETFARLTSIDTIASTFNASFISMDIEGAELDALKGSINLLNRCRPILAICLYHSVDHLWSILNFLHGLDLGYKFWIRNYSSFSSETVLYASA